MISKEKGRGIKAISERELREIANVIGPLKNLQDALRIGIIKIVEILRTLKNSERNNQVINNQKVRLRNSEGLKDHKEVKELIEMIGMTRMTVMIEINEETDMIAIKEEVKETKVIGAEDKDTTEAVDTIEVVETIGIKEITIQPRVVRH
jgi:hypothetical protein